MRLAGHRTGRALAVLLLGIAAVPAVAPGAGAEELAAAIYEGACADAALEPADDLGPVTPIGGAADGGGVNGAGAPLLRARATVGVGLEHLLDEGAHAIGVAEGPAGSGTLVACADLAGAVDGVDDGVLAVAVRPVGAAGIVGVALLRADGEGRTRVTAYLIRDAAPPREAATPTP